MPPSKPASTLKSHRWMFWLLLLLGSGFLFVALLIPGATLNFDSEALSSFGAGWTLLDETDQAVQTLTLPATIEGGSRVRLSKVVPEGLPYPAVLGFRSSHQQVRLYCDGELLYSFGYGSPQAFGKSPGSVWNLVRLPKDSAGMTLMLELTSPYPAYQKSLPEIQVGSKAAQLFSLLRQYVLSLLLTLVIFTTGIVTLIVYFLVIRKSASASKEMLYLGLFAVFVSLWLFCEGRLTQFFNMPPAFNLCLTFVAMLATPIPLVRYIACGRSPHSQRLLEVAVKALSVLFVLSILLQAFGLVDFIEQLPLIHSVFIFACAALLYAVIYDLVRRPSVGQHWVLISLGILALFFLLETVNLYIGNRKVGGMMQIGMLLFISIQANFAFRNATQMMRMSRLASVDTLTNCFNRNAYNQHLAALDGKADVGVVIADINDLKLINDTYGHDTGDDAITRCAAHFSTAFSLYGRCFRIGGDEFAMLGEGLSQERLESLCTSFQSLCADDGTQVNYPFSISCGCTLFDPVHDQSLSDAMRRADKIMYENKRQSKQKAGQIV